jgi:hypothetical protein
VNTVLENHVILAESHITPTAVFVVGIRETAIIVVQDIWQCGQD